MIVLDTNVLSETLKPLPNAAVVAWMAAQPRSTLFTTTVVEAEILYGVGVSRWRSQNPIASGTESHFYGRFIGSSDPI